MHAMTEPGPDAPAPRPREEPTLLTLLSGIAHRATDTQLVAACVASLLASAGVFLVARGWWRLSLPLLAIGCFSVWAIAERDGSRRPVVRMLQAAAAFVGVLSAFAFGLVLLMAALGTWIS
jgi:hypothetical protein